MHLTLQDGLWFVHIPFVSMVNFQFLAQFPVGHLFTQMCAVFTPALAGGLSLECE